jgi:phosphoribosylaminoimidazolecarboxamide formyltransferase/IMP cyclohydrolase
MSRVDASFLAVRKAGERAVGAVMASDAFFPFPDAVEVAADAGVTAVIHPGGSIRDEDVLGVAESRGMAVVVTGRRHFRH